MSKILKMTDRLKISINDVSFIIGPLSYYQKAEITGYTYIEEDAVRFTDYKKAQFFLVKYGLKGIDGVFDLNGEKYNLEFEPNGQELTDNAVSEVFALQQFNQYIGHHWEYMNVWPEKDKKSKGVALELLSKKSNGD